MSDYPQTLTPGDRITKTWIDDLLRALRRQRPLAGPGIRTRATPNGTVLTAERAGPTGTRTETPSLFPFKVRFAPSEEENAEPPGGDFLIYIPSGSLTVDGHAAGGEDFGLAAREGEAGWYVLPQIVEDAEVWISFEYAPAEDPPLSCSAGTAPEHENPDDVRGKIARSVHVADVELPEDASPKVTQQAKGPLVYEFFVDSLNGLMGDLAVAADPDASVAVDDTEIFASVVTDEETGKILVGLTGEAPPEEAGGGEGYCNDVSRDDANDGLGNDISDDGGGGGGGSGASLYDRENAISRWPCKKGER